MILKDFKTAIDLTTAAYFRIGFNGEIRDAKLTEPGDTQ
jgi:hypothetical protein